MRLWSLHPRYLDSKGLTALWREALLAKKALEGKTVGYRNHPQLHRFKECKKPVGCMNQYLECIYKESAQRGYNFDRRKITKPYYYQHLTVSDKQLEFEVNHLLIKLKTRYKPGFIFLHSQRDIDPHPLFNIIQGEVEAWEKLS